MQVYYIRLKVSVKISAQCSSTRACQRLETKGGTVISEWDGLGTANQATGNKRQYKYPQIMTWMIDH